MDLFLSITRLVLPILGLFVLLYSSVSLLKNIKSKDSKAYLQNTFNGDVISLHYGENSIGRSKTCDITINYPTVSRLHAVISFKKGGWQLTDTHSSTGTTVNGKKIEERTPLREEDNIAFGGNSFILKYKSKMADIPISKN
ncbi:MAG: FHA domain-containing protein [Clostridiales bacterium]|nr:FHA domain-containing protein [Clostridiales bacterium]